ncbi:FRIGIDA-like protein 1 [Prosopis cineraria]|uniref:FRIGIDA-like protein 1 n=1 Tax=Prosopis cineraria TaxID=364024 RepID=UPI002410B5B9|nr:FRIGIDA-like protein 1 [Prosopis cineraria]
MATLNSISAALKLIDAKKENLKKAYDELQTQYSLLFSTSRLSWSDIDSHFTSIQNSLTQRFQHLESLETRQCDPQLGLTTQSIPVSSSPLTNQNPKIEDCPSVPNDPPSSSNPSTKNVTDLIAEKTVVLDAVAPRRELVAFCEKMDGKGLRKYVIEHFRRGSGLEDELPGALRCAPDPAAMVLDSLDGFCGANGMKNAEIRRIRTCCSLFLGKLRAISPKIEFNAREKARKLASEWKWKFMTDDRADATGASAYLHLVLTYGLVSEVSMDDLVEISAMAASNKEVPELCRIMGLVDKVPDLVQKLVGRGKYVLAVKYVMEFNLADKIPPVPILRACVNDSEKLAKRILEEGKPPAEATSREIHKLRSVIKAIQSHKLESEYPISGLEQRIELLEKEGKKRPAYALAAKPQPQSQQHQQQQQQQHQKKNIKSQERKQHNGNKLPRVSVPAVQQNAGSASSALHQYQLPFVHSTGLLTKHQDSCLSSQATPYSMVGPTPTISPYTGPSAGSYDFASVPMGSSGNPSQVGSHPYSSEPNFPSGYYDRITAYSGLPHYYRSSYYPQ